MQTSTPFVGITPNQEPKYGVDRLTGKLFNRASGAFLRDDMPIFILLAKDRRALEALKAYADYFEPGTEHRRAVEIRIGQFKRWQDLNAKLVQEPDTFVSDDFRAIEAENRGELFGEEEAETGGAAMTASEKEICCTPCCNYHYQGQGPIYWNPFNKVVQCHNCGTRFVEVRNSSTGLDFGQALRAMEEGGKRVKRAGWDGAWLSVSGDGVREIPSSAFWSPNNAAYAASREGGKAKVLPCITMKTPAGEIMMGWVPTQADMLSEDWELVEDAIELPPPTQIPPPDETDRPPDASPSDREVGFRNSLTRLLNRCSRENGSDTPDFILADFLARCLSAFDETLQQREKWYGRKVPAMADPAPPAEIVRPVHPYVAQTKQWRKDLGELFEGRWGRMDVLDRVKSVLQSIQESAMRSKERLIARQKLRRVLEEGDLGVIESMKLIKEARMWLGEDLGQFEKNNPGEAPYPYPGSDDPQNPVIHKAAD